ncbi:Mitochondrial distribution and morphology protein 12, partial [Linderina macrospora]
MQDDKHELAFLAHHHDPCLGGELERARLILPLLANQLQPSKVISTGLPDCDRELLPAPVSIKIYDELETICDFNAAARSRLAAIEPFGVMSEFAVVHLRRIIRQLLAEIDVEPAAGWDNVVFNLAVSAVANVRPDVRHGDNMDLRRYVRIKRIPGGTPSDSQYITGIVFTKNLAHKRMPRVYTSPRIMLLAFPLEHVSHSRYVSFDDELRVQQGFAEKLVQRIVGAGPDIVLVEKTVPRNILESLMRNKIAVAYGVKRSVLRAIARCTGAEIVTSMDKFSGYPRTGICRELVVQTYEDPSLPEIRKSFVFLDGCEPERGGTIVLRGAEFDRLADIKQVMDLAVCFAYSLYLETALLIDEFALSVPGQYHERTIAIGQKQSDGKQPDSLAALALDEYNIVLSSSPCVRIPPPHILKRMREKELAIREITDRFNKLSSNRRDSLSTGNDDSIQHSTATTGVAFLVSRQQSAASTNRMLQQYESEMALHESYIREGENFLDANPQTVSIWDYQSIVLSYMVTCRKHAYLVCAGPQHHAISFYGRTDVTLGQYLEDMCFDLNYDCPGSNKQCTHPMYEHRRSYIHHTGKVEVTMDEHPSPIERLSDIILMWGDCKVCGKSTPVTKMSDATWRYSFGKYLETTFYNDQLRPRASVCNHDMHHDYIRCFALRHMVVKFEYAPLDLWGIAVPTIPLYFDVEVSIRLKEREAAELRVRLEAYYTSLLSCLETFPMDMVYEEKLEECKGVVEALRDRAATEQVYFRQSLEQTIRNSHPADTLVVVVVYEQLQTKVVEWNLQFSDLAQGFIQLDAASRSSAMKRITSTEGLGSAGASVSKDHAIDSLEVIDELHSAADHHHVPVDIVESPPFTMPSLGSSPSD